MKTLYSILDYERMKSDLDGCPHNRIEVAAVEMALNEIPEQYKQAIWNNIFYKENSRNEENNYQSRKANLYIWSHNITTGYNKAAALPKDDSRSWTFRPYSFSD